MHIIFERPKGRFRSNCNILALAWTPYCHYAGHQCQMKNFGWLAIGNIGKLIGVTLTSLVSPPREIDGRKSDRQEQCNKQRSEDLITLDDDGHEDVQEIVNSNEDQGKVRHRCSTTRPERTCVRGNYNLRGHRDEIILVQWNDIYQKLATVDSKGNVLIWCRANEKFTIQTPFYNRSKSVADFKWSNDGKTALICYTDSFILVGGSSGQRHWHSMLNLEDYHITCASWTPNDEQLLLGVSNGNVVLIDLPRSELTELLVGQSNIRTMCWSPGRKSAPSCMDGPPQTDARRPDFSQAFAQDISIGPNDSVSSCSITNPLHGYNSAVVNRRRLSLNCALFCRHCPSNVQGVHNRDCTRRPDQQQPHERHNESVDTRNASEESTTRHHPQAVSVAHKDILAIDFANNTIRLFEGGLSDKKPREIQVNLESYLMAWSSSGQILAVAGFTIYTSAPSVGYLRCKYTNSIKFYSQTGGLIHEHKMSFTRYPITALAWGHSDQRLFVATGPKLHCARVCLGIPSLSLLTLSCLHRHTKTMDKADVLRSLLQKKLVPSVLNWQSFNCPIDLTLPTQEYFSSPRTCQQKRAKPTGSNSDATSSRCPAAMATTDTEGSGLECSPGDQVAALTNNINVAKYQLPAKLLANIDRMFLQTLRQPFDEQLSPNDIIWHVPKNQQRHYCTLICYTHELPDIGCLGHQYKAQELTEQFKASDSAVSSSSSTSLMSLDGQPSDHYKIFVLYVEHQGSLIPILKARRIGFLKPEFVIFDPERVTNSKHAQQLLLHQHQKVSDVSDARRRQQASSSAINTRANVITRDMMMHDGNGPMGNCSELHNDPAIFDGSSPSPSSGLLSSSSRPNVGLEQTPKLPSHPMLQDPYLIYLLNLSQKKTRGSNSHRRRQQQQSKHSHHQGHQLLNGQANSQETSRIAIERYRMLARATGSPSSSRALATSPATTVPTSSRITTNVRNTLPETSELVRIRSNIWGTKFKLINVGNRTIGMRAKLGTVVYRASFLHLQPRQIFLNFKDMTNYCALCSMHHHTKLAPKQPQRLRDGRSPGHMSQARAYLNSSSNSIDPVSLIDLPLANQTHCLATPARTSSRRSSSAQNQRRTLGASRGNNNLPLERSQSAIRQADSDLVILPAGDIIRVAPKLDMNQRYQFASGARGNLGPLPSPQCHRTLIKPGLRQVDKLRQSLAGPRPLRSTSNDSPVASTSGANDSTNDSHMIDNNDILTLSLEQGDQVRVEMSSLSNLETPNNSTRQPEDPSQSNRSKEGLFEDERKMDEFLQANRTLKSIQTITKMIVDLSSRAQSDANDAGHPKRYSSANPSAEDSPTSPVKLFKSSDGQQQRSPTQRYVPPDTPVHRPNKRAGAHATQSVTSTPMRMTNRRSHRRQESGHAPVPGHSNNSSFDSECALPSAPPSVPFRRKLSSSAKRLFDGSLRSLTGIGSAGPGGYTTSEDFDSEDCKALVGQDGQRYRRLLPAEPQSRRTTGGARHQSQPCSPMRGTREDQTGLSRIFNRSAHGRSGTRQSTLDLAQLRAQVVQKLRQSTGWMSSSESKLEIDVSRKSATPTKCTKRSRWVHRSGSDKLCEPFGYRESIAASAGSSDSAHSSSSSSSSRSSSDDERDLDFTSSDEDKRGQLSLIDRAIERTRWLRRKTTNKRQSASARNLNELGRMSLEKRDKELADASLEHNDRGQHARQSESRKTHNRRSRRRPKQSICSNSNCCCSREIKLSNRPPVWSEYSQVYQLDFGGRVTQESAKNLQIDFNGNLALQFGRVDKCTYTLDYKYPFNAVQAMSIALASLTQRLK